MSRAARASRPSFDGGRDDAGRDQFDEYGNPIYTDEQVREFVDFYSSYLDTGADYFEIDDVDEVDRYYDRSFANAIARAGINLFRRDDRGKTQQVKDWIKPDRYIEATGAPEYLKELYAPSKKRNEDEAQYAYAMLYGADSPEEITQILSAYYGYDFVPSSQELGEFGGRQPEVTGSPEEFHSFIEPILKEQITYLQATQGLNYQDALVRAFETDPMLQGLYGKYGVPPVRQTDDGSTYVYDPFTYGELRTFESKDRDFQNALKIVAAVAISYFAPGYLANTGIFKGLGLTALQTKALASAVVSGSLEAIKGGSFGDVLKAFALGGIQESALELIKSIPLPSPPATDGISVTLTGAARTTLGDILPDWLEFTDEINKLGVSPLSAQGMINTAADLITNGTFSTVFGDGANEAVRVCYLLAQEISDQDDGGAGGITAIDLTDAIELYEELRAEGRSHLAIMEELGYEPSDEFKDRVQAGDLARLQTLREENPKAYIDALGKVDTDTGAKHENEVYNETEDPSAFERYGMAKIIANPEDYGVPEEYAEGFSDFMSDFVGFVLPNAEETARKIIPGLAQFAKDALSLARQSEDLSTLVNKLPIAQFIDLIPQEFIDEQFAQAEEIGALASPRTDALKQGIANSNQRLAEAEQRARDQGLDEYEIAIEVAKAFGISAVEDPYALAMNTLLVEAVEEVVPLMAGGLAKVGAKVVKGGVAKASKAFGKDLSDVLTSKIAEYDPTDAAVFAEFATDIAEGVGLEYKSAYDEAYDLKINQFAEQRMRIAEAKGESLTYDEAVASLSPEQIAEAEEHATFTGVMTGLTSGIMTTVSQKFGGGAERMRSIFGDEGFVGKSINTIVDGIANRTEVILKEGLSEGFEEAAVSVVRNAINMGEGLVDDVSAIGDTVYSFLTGLVVGNTVTAGAVITGDAKTALDKISESGGIVGKSSVDVIGDVVSTVNSSVRGVIEGAKAGVITDAQARGALADLGITTDEYGTLQTSLMNQAFDDDYTTYTESRDAFEAENPDYIASEADILEFTGARAEDRLEASVADLVDRSYIDAQEVINTAAREGLALTQEQAAEYVQQTESGKANEVLKTLRSEVFDPLYVTKAEAKAIFKELGYDPTDTDLAEFIGKTEAEAEAEDGGVADYTVDQLLLKLDGLLKDPTATAKQIDRVLDQIEFIDEDSTARDDAGIDDDGNRIPDPDDPEDPEDPEDP